MSDVITSMVALKHRLLGERATLDRKISALGGAIDELQECPRESVAQMGPEEVREEPQAAPATTSLIAPPAAAAPFIDWPAQAVGVTAISIPEKAAPFPDAPPPQPVVAPTPPAAPIEVAGPSWATQARCHILATHYPRRAHTSREIMALLAMSPGPRIPDWGNISRYAVDVLGLAPTNRSHSPTPSKKDAAIPILYDALIAKAAEWGITEINPDDLLAAVNTKAARIGHKPYALQSRSP